MLLNEYFRTLYLEEMINKNPMDNVEMIKKANFLSAQGKEDLTETCRRTGGRPIPVGWLRLQVDGLMQTEFCMEQSIYYAQVKMRVPQDGGALLINSWICAVQNTLIIELENQSEKDAVIDFSIMPGEYDVYEVSGYDDGYTENAVWFAYGAEPYNVPGKRCVAAAASTDTATRYCRERMAKKGGIFTVKADEKVKLQLTLLSDLDCENPKEKAWLKPAAMYWILIIIPPYTGWGAVLGKAKCRRQYSVAGQQAILLGGREHIH